MRYADIATTSPALLRGPRSRQTTILGVNPHSSYPGSLPAKSTATPTPVPAPRSSSRLFVSHQPISAERLAG